MSEANNTWQVPVDDQQHQVEVDHSTMTGKIVVTLDGAEVGEERMLARSKSVTFPLGSSTGEVTLHFAYGGFAAKSELHVDGKYVEPLRR